MNRREFERYLRTHGCVFERHGGSHDVWINPASQKQTSVPRHNTIKPGLARKICKQLDIPKPPNL